MLKQIVLIACLIFCAIQLSQAGKNVVGTPRNGVLNGVGSGLSGVTLTLKTITSSLCEGTFLKGNVAIDFTSRPGLLTLSVLGTPLLSVCDFGAFLKVSVGGKIFLVASAPDILNRVIDVTNKLVKLPQLDGSELLSLSANLDIFKSLVASLSLNNLLGCENKFAELMIDLSATVELELIVDLSIELALRGINGIAYPCVQPLHLTALRLLKVRADINVDADIIARANALVSVDASVSLPGACALTNSCGNKCLGLCGVDCTCFKWVCGGCDGFLGCRNQDCGCDCKDAKSWLCVNLAVTRCSGTFNGCSVLGLVQDLVGHAL